MAECTQRADVVVISVSAGIFRFLLTLEWGAFILEKRGADGSRPGGNTFRNTPKLRQMMGHLIIQTVSTIGMVVACSIAGTQLDSSDPGSPGLSIVSVGHTGSLVVTHSN